MTYSYSQTYFLNFFSRHLSRFQIIIPFLLFAIVSVCEFLFLIGLSNWKWFEDFVNFFQSGKDNYEDHDHPYFLQPMHFIYILLYGPIFLLFGPRSLLSSLSGFLFGFQLGWTIDMFGVAFGVSSISIFTRTILLPFLSYYYTVDEQLPSSTLYASYSSPISSLSSSSSATDNLYGAHHTGNQSFLESHPSILPFSTSIISNSLQKVTSSSSSSPSTLRKTAQRVKLIQKMSKRLNHYKLVAIFNASPLFPIHITAYTLNLSRIEPFAIILVTTLFNIPTSLFYASLGSSFPSLQDLLGNSPGLNISFQELMIVFVSVIMTIIVVRIMMYYTNRLAVEIEDEDLLQANYRHLHYLQEDEEDYWSDERDDQVYYAIEIDQPLQKPIILCSV